MDNVSKFIVAVAGIILAALIIAWGVAKYRESEDNAKKADEMTQASTQAMLEEDWLQYEGTEITGSQVINVIKHFQSLGQTYVSVDNHKAGETFYIFTDASLANKQSDADLRDALKLAKKRGEATYINPSAKFMGSVERDASDGTVLGIKFEIQY